MRLSCLTDKGEGVIVGYCPGPKGIPRAIVVFPDATLDYFSLDRIKLTTFPIVEISIKKRGLEKKIKIKHINSEV